MQRASPSSLRQPMFLMVDTPMTRRLVAGIDFLLMKSLVVWFSL